MILDITERHSLALKKQSPTLFRSLKVKDASNFEPHRFEWSELHEVRKQIKRASTGILDKLQKGEVSDAECRDLDLAHEAAMALYDACDSEMDARTVIGSLEARSTGGSPNRPIPEDGEAYGQGVMINRGASDPAEAFALKPEQRMVDWTAKNRSGEQFNGLSEGQYLRAMVLGAKTEAEKRALSEGSDSAGGYTVPDILSARLIDRLRASSVVMRAGATMVPLTSKTNYIAKVLTDPAPGWRAEAAAVAESDPTFGRVTLEPKSLAVLIKVSRELLEDSLNLETQLPQIMAAAMAVEVDRAALFGSGASNQPTGIANTSGINTIAHSADLTTYTPLVRARTAILEDNGPGITAYVMHPRDDGALAELVDTTGQPLNRPQVIERTPFLTTTAVPTNGGVGTNESKIIAGHWPSLLIGMRTQLEIGVSKDIFMDTLQVGFVAHLRMDVAVEHATNFCAITGITPT